jgi:hypothetical protein
MRFVDESSDRFRVGAVPILKHTDGDRLVGPYIKATVEVRNVSIGQQVPHIEPTSQTESFHWQGNHPPHEGPFWGDALFRLLNGTKDIGEGTSRPIDVTGNRATGAAQSCCYFFSITFADDAEPEGLSLLRWQLE